ncbi:MAG: fused MFS/spermidine synthase [Verrucomicrobia bacterium]|nr:fused MFS/spermidine synthase [Verrucomicrobiota bacterium]
MAGALALIYEVLWLRRFAVIFGATTPAAAATLSAVFLGFAVGSAVIGARAGNFKRPLYAYGIIEIAAGLGALLVEPFLRVYDGFYPVLYHELAGSPTGFAVVKTLLAMVALFTPTFFMGGTVPLLGHALATARGGRLGVTAGGLYAANTVGAALGALSVPFIWLPKLGAAASYGACVGGSVVVGAVACWLGRGQCALGETASKPPLANERAAAKEVGGSLSKRALATLAGLSGALMFVLQVSWTRMFAQVHENSIYSFAVVVAVFIVGLAGGASLARELLRRNWRARRTLGLAWVAAGVAVFASPFFFVSLTDGLGYLQEGGGWTTYAARMVWLTVPTVLLPMLLAGMVLPVLLELAGGRGGAPAGRTLGWLLATNTAGVVVGSLAAAFILPRWLGLWVSIALAGIVMVMAGELCLGEWRRRKLRLVVVFALVGISFFVFKPAKLPRTRVRESRGEKLLAVAEGSHGIVSVVESRGSRRLKLDNYYILGGSVSTGDERMQTHIPLLLHPAPKRVAFLGFGTGITAGAALLHPVERITGIEIVPEVVQAAKDHFAGPNLGGGGSPRVELIVEDARNVLRASGQQFDVIVGDLVVPWRRGESALFSAEHFAAARRALAPGGLFCQWLPAFQLSAEEFRIVVATFLDVFPRATPWRGDFAPDQPALALVGHADDAAVIDPNAVARRVRELRPDQPNPHLAHEAGLWIFFVGPLASSDPEFSGARRNRENRPWLELLGPMSHAGASRGERGVFAGRRLETYLDKVRGKALQRSPVQALDEARLLWR